MIREGSACKNLRGLIKGLNPHNSRRCIFCTDDCQPKTIFEIGHINNHLRIAVEEGIDAITAIQMATINSAECFGLHDRGAIVPSRRADIVIFEDLKNFDVSRVFVAGKEVAKDGKYYKNIADNDLKNSNKGHTLPFILCKCEAMLLSTARRVFCAVSMLGGSIL